jgi:hypothetical protein
MTKTFTKAERLATRNDKMQQRRDEKRQSPQKVLVAPLLQQDVNAMKSSLQLKQKELRTTITKTLANIPEIRWQDGKNGMHGHFAGTDSSLHNTKLSQLRKDISLLESMIDPGRKHRLLEEHAIRKQEHVNKMMFWSSMLACEDEEIPEKQHGVVTIERRSVGCFIQKENSEPGGSRDI